VNVERKTLPLPGLKSGRLADSHHRAGNGTVTAALALRFYDGRSYVTRASFHLHVFVTQLRCTVCCVNDVLSNVSVCTTARLHAPRSGSELLRMTCFCVARLSRSKRPCLYVRYILSHELMMMKWKGSGCSLSEVLFRSFFCGVGLTPPLGPLFRSPRFRFLRSLCSSPLGPCKSQHCGHTLAYCAFPG
jgi:hypothetical protein